jgi:hypothetical protein
MTILCLHTVCGQKSKRISSKSRIYAFPPPTTLIKTMPKQPRTPRTPLCELYPDTTSRVVSARDYIIRYSDISEKENLIPSTYRSGFKKAKNEASCKTGPRTGRP